MNFFPLLEFAINFPTKVFENFDKLDTFRCTGFLDLLRMSELWNRVEMLVCGIKAVRNFIRLRVRWIILETKFHLLRSFRRNFAR